MEVLLADDVPNALAGMISERLTRTLARYPRRARLVRGGRVSMRAADIGLSATLELGPLSVTVRNGGGKGAQVRIRAVASDLVALADASGVLGVPNPFREPGRRVLAGLFAGRIRLKGALRHPLLLLRFSRLLRAE
jgi:hypothetical protein